jgi:hypothetical protein
MNIVIPFRKVGMRNTLSYPRNMVIGITPWRLMPEVMRRIGIYVINKLKISYEKLFESNISWVFGPLVN